MAFQLPYQLIVGHGGQLSLAVLALLQGNGRRSRKARKPPGLHRLQHHIIPQPPQADGQLAAAQDQRPALVHRPLWVGFHPGEAAGGAGADPYPRHDLPSGGHHARLPAVLVFHNPFNEQLARSHYVPRLYPGRTLAGRHPFHQAGPLSYHVSARLGDCPAGVHGPGHGDGSPGPRQPYAHKAQLGEFHPGLVFQGIDLDRAAGSAKIQAPGSQKVLDLAGLRPLCAHHLHLPHPGGGKDHQDEAGRQREDKRRARQRPQRQGRQPPASGYLHRHLPGLGQGLQLPGLPEA